MFVLGFVSVHADVVFVASLCDSTMAEEPCEALGAAGALDATSSTSAPAMPVQGTGAARWA